MTVLSTEEIVSRLLKVERALIGLTAKDVVAAGNAIEELNPVIMVFQIELREKRDANFINSPAQAVQ